MYAKVMGADFFAVERAPHLLSDDPDFHNLEDVLVQVKEMVCILDKDWKLTFVNQQFLNLYGLTSTEQALGRTPFALYPDFHRSIFYQALKGCFSEKKPGATIGYSGKTNGYHLCRFFPYGDGVIMLASDISEEFANQEKLAKRATVDSLTSLPNRIALEHDAGTLIENETPFALAFMDLDRFKMVNDFSGHAVGDHVLMEMGFRFTHAVDANMRAYRTGGDEFVFVTTAVGLDLAGEVQALLRAASAPVIHKGNEFVMGASAGIALFPEHGRTLDELMRRADLAMYRAKRATPGSFTFYEASFEEEVVNRARLEQRLRRAVQNCEFEMYYQPKAFVRNGRMCGAEALIRWILPETNEFISPDVFLPMASEIGLIEEIDRWVMETTIRHASELMRSGYPTKISINLSAKSLSSGATGEVIRGRLRENGLPGNLLEVEITESALMEDIDASRRMLSDMASLGVGVSVDDFGTGYSSLSYLVTFPVDTLKIDRQFVQDMETHHDNQKIVLGLIRMAGSLGMTVVAEGVETKEQLDLLSRFKCDCIQGYFFARPMPFSELPRFVVNDANAHMRIFPEPNPFS